MLAGSCSSAVCRLLHVALEPEDAELLRDYYDDLEQRRAFKLSIGGGNGAGGAGDGREGIPAANHDGLS